MPQPSIYYLGVAQGVNISFKQRAHQRFHFILFSQISKRNASIHFHSGAAYIVYDLHFIYFVFVGNGRSYNAHHWRPRRDCKCSRPRNSKHLFVRNGHYGFHDSHRISFALFALVNVSIKAWWKFIYPLLIILFFVSSLFLIIGIYFK